MGLDIYLYKFNGEDFDTSINALEYHEEKIESIISNIIKDFLNGREYSDLTEEEFTTLTYLQLAATQEYIKEHNLPLLADNYGLALDETKIELHSKTDPNHLFKIGYFRSSYNGSGINGVLSDTIGTDLYQIFEASSLYRVKPNWKSAKENLQSALSMMENDEGYSVMKFASKHNCQSATDALNIFREELKTKSHIGDYSNGKGEFFLNNPIPVHGMIMGTTWSGPCVYLIYKNEQGRQWYINAIKIMIETCDYVLQQEDSDRYYFHWSS
jgi:hypothetical protein